MVRKIKSLIVYTASALVLPISIIMWLLNFRFLNVCYIQNIGHLSLEPDCYLKDTIVGKRKKRKPIIVAPTKRIFASFPKQICCSEALLDLWGEHFYIVKSPYLALIFKLIRKFNFLDEDVEHYTQDHLGEMEAYPIYYNWNSLPCVSFPGVDTPRGIESLQLLKIPENAPFVIFANRDPSYKSDKSDFSCRNGDIDSYHLALKYLAEEGFYCVRIGHHKSQPLNWGLLAGYEDKIIDYTKSSCISGWRDIFLIANASMFLSGPSGLREVANLFDTPVVSLQQVPMLNMPFKRCDIGLPKIYLDQRTSEEIPFTTVLSTLTGKFIFDYEFKEHNIALRSNTPEEILMAVKESIQLLRGGTREKTALQKAFEAQLPKSSLVCPMAARVSNHFLQKYEHLL